MTTDPALIERMEKLVRDMAPNAGTGPHGMKGNHYSEAHSIAALLPDKDMEAAQMIGNRVYHEWADASAVGPDYFTQAALAGIKHGRANP